MNKFVFSSVAFLSFIALANEPIATFEYDDIASGAVINGITLDLNGNACDEGIVTIGEKPILVKGVSSRSVKVAIEYFGKISPQKYVIATAQSGDTADVTGVWSDGARITGVWKGDSWANVNVPASIASSDDERHDCEFFYSADSGTRLIADGVEVYRANPLKSISLPPTAIAIGGAMSEKAASLVASGLKITKITVYR